MRRLTTAIALLATLALAMTAMFAVRPAAASSPSYSEDWDGRGADSLKCEYADGGLRPETGWIHWIFSTKGDSTSAKLTLGGTGSGAYDPGPPLNSNTWHFYTPYFDVNGLTATIELYGGGPGGGSGLVISDYCPGLGNEQLEVSKTVETTFDREHLWSIAKEVDPTEVYLYTDGSGDTTATWTVNVTYGGYVDSGWNVSGAITIENTGTLDAVIASVEDVMGGAPIEVDCGVGFPYTLPVGETLTCTYDEGGYFEGYNVVTVTTERDEYAAQEEIVWGEPAHEANASVTVTDESDLTGIQTLGTVVAAGLTEGEVTPFTYTHAFAWGDYGKDNCGNHTYTNTARIIGDNEVVLGSDTAEIKVYVQCFIYETAFANDQGNCFLNDGFSRWGWTTKIGYGTYTWDLWAAAGQCDTSKGTRVGTVTVTYSATEFTVVYNLDPGYVLDEQHVYAGSTKYPQVRQGRNLVNTVAPGQYYISSPLSGEIWVIVHGVVGLPDPNFP